MQKYKHIFASCLLLTLSTVSPKLYAETVDGVPIPPKRPDVMSVSPAYIEYLRNKSNNKTPSSQNNEAGEPDYNQAPPPTQPVKKSIDSKTAIKNINSNEVLAAIEGNSNETHTTPSRKPLVVSEAQSMNEIKTQAGQEPETTLVSFAIEPGEIHINQDVESFLKNHALRLFKNNKNMSMQIHAYATPVDNTEYSDIRLSLARALEVRSFLIKHDVDPTRLKLSPMGADNKNNSDDRIDLVFIEPAN